MISTRRITAWTLGAALGAAALYSVATTTKFHKNFETSGVVIESTRSVREPYDQSVIVQVENDCETMNIGSLPGTERLKKGDPLNIFGDQYVIHRWRDNQPIGTNCVATGYKPREAR